MNESKKETWHVSFEFCGLASASIEIRELPTAGLTDDDKLAIAHVLVQNTAVDEVMSVDVEVFEFDGHPRQEDDAPWVVAYRWRKNKDGTRNRLWYFVPNE